MARRNRFVAFAAGLGAGYLQGKKQNDDRERQTRIDNENADIRAEAKSDRETARLDKAETRAKEKAYTEGMANANAMKKGELITPDGAKAGLSQIDWEKRISDNTAQEAPRTNSFDTAPQAELSPEQVAAQADIYAKASQVKGAGDWIASDAPDAMIKKTSQGDIYRAKGTAAAKLGITGMPAAEGYQEKAKLSDVNDLKKLVLAPSTTADDLVKRYGDLPDGYAFSIETNPETGRLMTILTEESTGKRTLQGDKNGFADLNEIKKFVAQSMDDDPNKIIELMDKQAALKLAAAKEAAAVNQQNLENTLNRDKFNETKRSNGATEGISRQRLAHDVKKDGVDGRANDTAALTFIQKTTDSVAQKVAAKLELGGKYNPTAGKGKFGAFTEDGEGNRVQTGVKYTIDPKLAQHAQRLVESGVSEADAVQILSDRKTIKGKTQYTNFGSATVMEDGKPIKKSGIIYKGKLIPLE